MLAGASSPSFKHLTTMVSSSKRAALATAASVVLLSNAATSVGARDFQAQPKHQFSKRAAPNLNPNTISINDASQISGKSYDYVVVSAHLQRREGVLVAPGLNRYILCTGGRRHCWLSYCGATRRRQRHHCSCDRRRRYGGRSYRANISTLVHCLIR